MFYSRTLRIFSPCVYRSRWHTWWLGFVRGKDSEPILKLGRRSAGSSSTRIHSNRTLTTVLYLVESRLLLVSTLVVECCVLMVCYLFLYYTCARVSHLLRSHNSDSANIFERHNQGKYDRNDWAYALYRWVKTSREITPRGTKGYQAGWRRTQSMWRVQLKHCSCACDLC